MNSIGVANCDGGDERIDATLNPTVDSSGALARTGHSLILDPLPLPLRGGALLIDMVRMQQWPLLLDNPACVSRRQAKYCDGDGLYPLHWAVAGGAPLAIIQALVEAYPSALRRCDQEGSTPLHLAAQYGSQSLSYLLALYPKAAKRLDRNGRSPLYYAIKKHQVYSLEIIMELVRAAPSMITTPYNKPSANGVLSSSDHVAVSRQAAMRTPLYRLWNDLLLADPVSRPKTDKGALWDKAAALLQTAYYERHPLDSSRDAATSSAHVHAAIYLDLYLPVQVLPLLVSVYPEQLQSTDAVGRLPLSSAVSLTDGSRGPQPDDDGINKWALERCQKRVQVLLQAGPRAAHHINALTGRSALMEAIGAGHLWTGSASMATALPDGDAPSSVLQQLFETAPDMMYGRDGEQTGLPPALLAAVVQPISCKDAEVAVVADNSRRTRKVDATLVLSDKQRELIQALSAHSQALSAEVARHRCADADHLTTIFSLLRANPSQLVAFS